MNASPEIKAMRFPLRVGMVSCSTASWTMLRYRPPPRDRAAILYDRFVRKSGLKPAIGEAPRMFANRAQRESPLPATAVRNITNTYLDVRYGPPDPALLQRLEADIAAL